MHPDDGMILMQGAAPDMTQEDFDKRGNTAPETGYTVREIEIPMETEMDVEYFSRRIYVFLKCGDHYGKAEIWPVRISVDQKEKTFTSAWTSIGISINRTPGDRNVTAW